jgi:branched-chain amino acid transport system permease protein
MTSLFKSFEAAIDNSIGRRFLGIGLLTLMVIYILWFPLDSSQSPYTKNVFLGSFFFAILASSWALLAGIAGQFSFGHMGFLGIGAYVAGLFARDGLSIAIIQFNLPPESISSLGAIIVGTIAAGIFGLIIGWMLLRLKSSYLALFTIAFSELFRIIMVAEFEYTDGINGLRLRPLIVMDDPTDVRNIGYYIMFFLLIASMILMYLISNSRIGLFLRAMREDEEAASSLGVNVIRYKVMIFVITSMIVGLAGGVYYSGIGAERVTPDALRVLQMSLVIAYAVIGGMESIIGAAMGAFIARYVLEWLREIQLPFGLTTIDGSTVIEPGFWRFALFGVVMVLTLRFMRNGLLFPIFQWFQGRDMAMQETVAKRKTDDELNETTDSEIEGGA